MVKEHSSKQILETKPKLTNVAPFQILYQDEPLKFKLSRQETSLVHPDVTHFDTSYKVKEETVQ